ncbi:MAG: 3-deoxy-manno-octulosonate cytidylyltransferase [Methanomicrobiales archaeon]|nr:3-deoxy-manno-octulosonate cytidylyltransferase [Methanomicrobiales archaeon]
MKIIGIIPARMASSRCPGKPMERINGIPMIGHVFFRSRLSSVLDEVYVATCDAEIRDYIASIGGTAIMTSPYHERASDRVAEALDIIEKNASHPDIVVMIQGDEPMLLPEMIEEAIRPMLTDPGIDVTNLMAPLEGIEEHEDPNEVKVVVDLNSDALYFSREAIPSRRKGAVTVPMYKQVCIIPFRRNFLRTYLNLTPTPLEQIESVDMLRVLEHGYKVRMVITPHRTYSVDTPEDLRFVEAQMKGDLLVSRYGSA